MRRNIALAVALILILSSLIVFSAPAIHAIQPSAITMHDQVNDPHYANMSHVSRFPKVIAQTGQGPVAGLAGGYASNSPAGVELLPSVAHDLSNASGNNSSKTEYYSISINFGVLPFSTLYGPWTLSFWFGGFPYYFIVNQSDYKGVHLDIVGFVNGTYYLEIGPTPFPYYNIVYSPDVVVDGSNASDTVTFISVQFEFEVYIVGVPEMTGLGLWTDYIGMPAKSLSFPPFTDITDSFFANSTAEYFVPLIFSVVGSSNRVNASESLIVAELTFYGSAGNSYFQYNVSMYLTNGTVIGGVDPAIVFNVTFSSLTPDSPQMEEINGLYLPPDAIFNNVSMSFYNAPGFVTWDGKTAGSYGGVNYPQSEVQTQVDLNLYKVNSTVGALNSLMTPYNNTGFSTFAFAWANLSGGSFFVVGAFVPEYGTAVIPGYAMSTGNLFTTLFSNYNLPLNYSSFVNVSAVANSTILVNDANLYMFYNTYYPYYAYYDYYPQLEQAVNLTQYSIEDSPYIPRDLMNFLPIDEAGMAVGGWGWNERWAYPVLYPSASYYGIPISGLPKWMGVPYTFSEFNESSSVAYLLGNYWNLSYMFSLYFVHNGSASPGWGGGETNVANITNGYLPGTNVSYWVDTMLSGSERGRGTLYQYYQDGWTPYLVLNVSIPYPNPSVTFYSGAEAVVGHYPAPNESFVSYSYFYNDSSFRNGTGWSFANSTYTVRLLSFGHPSTVSYMYGIMRNDYVVSFINDTNNSIVPFATNYSMLSNGSYGSVAGFPSEYAASYVEYAGSNPVTAGESGSLNFMSFGSFEYVLSYALYPYPVPSVYAVQGPGNGTYSSSNPFDYFSIHSFDGRTVFNVSIVNENYSDAFETSSAIGSTAFLSYNNLTDAFAVHTSYKGYPSGFTALGTLNISNFQRIYNDVYYPALETGNYSGAMIEPSGKISYNGTWENVSIQNNQSRGVWLYIGVINQGNISLPVVFKWLSQLENTTTYNGTNVTTNLTQRQQQALMNNLSSYSYGYGEYDVLRVGYNNFSFDYNDINGTLLVMIPTNGTVVTLEVVNVAQVYYVYYKGVFGYLDSYVGSSNSTLPYSTAVPLWVFGIIPASLILMVAIHDVINWFMGGTDRDSIFFWRKKGGEGGENGE
jgi:hypothetical protein